LRSIDALICFQAASAQTTSAMTSDLEKKTQQLIEAGRIIDSKGWVPATSGNFSVRLDNGNILVTVSGKHKGRLTSEDFMIVDPSGSPLENKKPSAELGLHVSVYQRYPSVGAVLHPHTAGSILISRLFPSVIKLSEHELLKAFEGITTHETSVSVPIFPNDQNIPRLAASIDRFIEREGDIRAYIIANHGLYTWGSTLSDALRHLEALEFMFQIETRLLGLIP
jgi:methylthioribulose-1-phosphate dehydratase